MKNVTFPASSAKKTVAEKKKEEPISSPSMTLRVRKWNNKDDAIDSDTDETKPKKKTKEDGLVKATTEFGGAIGLCISLALILGLSFGGLLLLKSVGCLFVQL